MNATAYNPILNAIKAGTSAAYEQLSSPEAIDWYQEVAVTTLINTYVFTMTVTAFCCDLVETWLLEPQEFPAEAPSDDDYDLIDLALPASPVIGLLMPAKVSSNGYKPAIYRLNSRPAALPASLFSTVKTVVKSIVATSDLPKGGAATSCQGYLFYRR